MSDTDRVETDDSAKVVSLASVRAGVQIRKAAIEDASHFVSTQVEQEAA